MVTVKFTPALKRFFPELDVLEISGQTIYDVVEKVEVQFPGIKCYLVEESGSLRKHVNIYINNTLIKDRNRLTDTVASGSEVYIMQALSGG